MRKVKRQPPSKRGGMKLPLVPSPPLSKNHRATLTFGGRMVGTEAAVGTGIVNFFRLNGAYDPDAAVGGNALPGLAAIGALYRSMRVWKVAIEVDATAVAPSIAHCMLSVIPTAFQAVLPSNQDCWPVQRLAVSRTMKVGGMNDGSVAFEGSVAGYYQPHVVANITPGQYADEADYASLTNGLPTRALYVAVAISTNCAGIVTMSAHVRVSYEIEFFDPYPLQ